MSGQGGCNSGAMSDLFKSALGYLGTNGSNSDDFVGQNIEISGIKLKIKKIIAEGSFVQLSSLW